ncbi:MAG: extracellular solute-binding protein [Acutalibacteraceae bacterium]|nr:extracellular solute-binding protein [Acutalibacteraceae bacterium]
MKTMKRFLCLVLSVLMTAALLLSGCQKSADTGKTEIEIVQYKQEAVKTFEKIEANFNATHDDIHLTISSPNDATTILKTRFIREDYPDIIGIGGDVNYSNFVDAGILMDISDYDGLKNVKQSYLDILEGLEFVPTEGVFGMPYAANAAGILYNKAMFQEHGWTLPTNWNELITLCDTIKKAGILPFYFGMKDTWTCLAPWNALCVDLAPADICQQVNEGKTTFTAAYKEVAEKMMQLLPYGEEGVVAYGYNDACTAFANGESAMYTIGSYAVPQILSVNPDMEIGSFVMPGNDDSDKQYLNSGVDLQFCVTSECPNKEAAYEVLRYLQDPANVQLYIDDQTSVPCENGDFRIPAVLDDMKPYIDNDKMVDYQDHHYPSEMSVDAIIQTMVINGDIDAFLAKFDKDWVRYNRDIIRKVQAYQAAHQS